MDSFQLLILRVQNHPHRNALWITEALLLIGLFLFRVWRFSRIIGFLQRLIFRLWTLALYIFLAGYVAPRLWIGRDFDQIVQFFFKSKS